jgi:hypothetical protein
LPFLPLAVGASAAALTSGSAGCTAAPRVTTCAPRHDAHHWPSRTLPAGATCDTPQATRKPLQRCGLAARGMHHAAQSRVGACRTRGSASVAAPAGASSRDCQQQA